MRQSVLDELNNSLQDNPQNVAAYYRRGLILAGRYIENDECLDQEEAPDTHQAIADFSRVIELQPEFHAAYYHKACLYFALDLDDEEAESLLQSALALDDGNILYMAKYVDVITCQGDNAQLGASIMLKVIEKAPTPAHYFSLAVNLVGCAEYADIMAETDHARQYYEKAIEYFELSKETEDTAKQMRFKHSKIEDCQAALARL